MMNFLLKKQYKLTLFRRVGCYGATVLVLLSLCALSLKGLNLGLDFTGGYLTEFTSEQTLSKKEMAERLSAFLPSSFSLSSAEHGHLWTVRQADNKLNTLGADWLTSFAQDNELSITPLDAMYLGSQVGDELIEQGVLAFFLALLMIMFYLSLRFEWRFALGAIVALFHDVIIVLGVFSYLGLTFDLTILASLLAIIGYSLNDSIVLADKLRELMKAKHDKPLDELINLAVSKTITRTLITSGTTLATIVAIWCVAGPSLTGFAIALFTGIIVGTFSSVVISATVPKYLGLTADYFHRTLPVECQLP